MQAWAMPASRYIFGTLPWYSVTMVSGIVLAIILALREEKRRGLPKDTIVDLALWIIPGGIVGARLYYVIFTWEWFRERPLAILEIWNGGLAIYGALLGGLAAAAVFARRRKLSLLTLTDMIVPGLALAQAIGRWGNYFNMEAYGLPITDAAWQFFPAGVLIPENQGLTWHMATFFYESLWDLSVFITLQALRKRAGKGRLFAWYVLLYGAGRLLVEGLRMDSLMAGEHLRISQLLSVGGCIAVFLLFAFLSLRGAPRRALLIGLLSGAALGLIYWLLPGQEAFVGYRLARSLRTACAGGSAAALAVSGRMKRPMAFLPALAAQIAELVLLTRGGSALLCAVFSLCAITACAGMYPHADGAFVPKEKSVIRTDT